MFLFRPLILVLFCVSLFADEEAERAAYIHANYSKYEYQIPMQDGAKLFTSVYVPNGDGGPWPIIMVRTPYSVAPYGTDKYKDRLGPTAAFEKEGFIFVFQDVRGRTMSEGTFRNMTPHRDSSGKVKTNESQDTHDTLNWLLKKLPNHNGRVGIWGISYPGFNTSASIIDTHPSIKIASPQAPIADWFWDDMHHNGAFNLNLAMNFFSGFGVARPEPTAEEGERFEHGTPDGYRFFLDIGPLANVNAQYFHGEIDFWNQFINHPNYDTFWQDRNILPHLKNITCAVMVVGGHYDAEDLYGTWNTYRAIQDQNKGDISLVIGPWFHGGWLRAKGDRLGDSYFGTDTSTYFQNRVLLPTFMAHLKDAPKPDLPEALIYETGANRWREFDQWPPKKTEARSLYLGPKDGLSWEKPKAQDGFAEFLSDPANPVPNTATITTAWGRDFMAEDQRFAGRRPDVLVFETPVLQEDLTLAGPIDAELWVSTDHTAADWMVKIIDVYPGDEPDLELPVEGQDEPEVIERGHAQILVRWEMIRGRFRESFEEPKPFEPGKKTKVTVRLQDVLHTFQKGHRLMIQVQSSYFPFFDRNPQNYVPNIFKAEEKDFVKANHRVYFDKDHASHLKVQTISH